MKSPALRNSLTLALLAGLLLSGCAKKALEQPPTPQTPPPTPTTPAPTTPTPSTPAPTPEPAPATPSASAADLQPVFFDYDSDALREDARGILDRNARLLRENGSLRLVVEGHCDERGTVEYNLALGEQRARATREYLVSLGVGASRLRVVSYGKERPLDPGSDEAAHARNRRARFAVSR
jgi:peptidoglycan-associated lipoprotein